MNWNRLRRPSVIVGLIMLGVVVSFALFAEWLSPQSASRMVPSIKYMPPVWLEGGDSAHLLGTDQLGRDLLSRIIHGARTSLLIAATAVLLSSAFGVTMGLVAGYFRGWTDVALMRLADIQLAFPFILLALAILSVSETKSAMTIIIVLAVADWVIHARVIRGRVLVEREKEYVRGARALGASHLRTMFVYILPSVLPTAIVIAMIELAVLMLVESVLAFLGLGIDPPAISWGTILAEGRRSIANAWWMLVFPGMAIFVAVLGVNLVADGLADILDPRLKLTGLVRRAVKRRKQNSQRAATAEPSQTDALLEVDNLAISFFGPEGPPVIAVQDVSFNLKKGERLGIVGESGSGKSVSALAAMGLLDPAGAVTGGNIRFRGQDVLAMSENELNNIRGRGMSMIFQDASASLNPVFRVGWQLEETIRLHQNLGTEEARKRALQALRMVNITEPERVAASYPFELSGGMQQRVMIAIALSSNRDLLIADEPTTALDVTTQAQILAELDQLVSRLNTGVILISHDLGVVADFTEKLIVMYAGVVCEQGETAEIIADPQHPYTKALLDAVHQLEGVTASGKHLYGDPLDTRYRPAGCPFAPRCELAMDICRAEMPLLELHGSRRVACHAVAEHAERSIEHVAR